MCTECDPNCELAAGCSTQGAGKCDSQCITGFVLDNTAHTCLSKHLNLYLHTARQRELSFKTIGMTNTVLAAKIDILIGSVG